MKSLSRACIVAFAAQLGQTSAAQHHDSNSDSISNLDLTTWNWDTWSVKIDSPPPRSFQSRIVLGNGYHGISLSSTGPFYDEDDAILSKYNDPDARQGWPLMTPRRTFATIAGFYDSQDRTPRTNYDWLLQYGGESVISGIPHWAGILFCVGVDTCFDASTPKSEMTSFVDEMDFKRGIKTTSLTWRPKKAGGASFELQYTTLAHKSRINLGMTRLDVTASAKFSGQIVDILDTRSAERSQLHSPGPSCDPKAASQSISLSPDGLLDVRAHMMSILVGAKKISCDSASAGSQAYGPLRASVDLKKDRKTTFIKYVGIASSDGFADPEQTAKSAATSAKKAGWDKLVAEHTKEWQTLVNPSTVTMYYAYKDEAKPVSEDLQLLQIGSIVSVFYLSASTGNADWPSGLNGNSVTVGGLGSDAYAGWIFWDSDLFMAPGYLLSHPRQAQTIGEYRVRTLQQARSNAQSNQHQNLHPETDAMVYQDLSNESIIYPWISGRFGNCTAAGPCRDYQYHVNTAIAMNLFQTYVVTGDEKWLRSRAWPVIKGIAHMYSEKVYFNETTRGYGLLNMSDPDEYANFVDDGAYTLASISKVLDIAVSISAKFEVTRPSNWSEIARNMAIPHHAESNITPEFNGMNGSITIKQFDVPGTTYPLDYRLDVELERNNLRYYSAAQSPDGPAMTYSFLSVVSAAVAPASCESFTLALHSLKPYLRAPWFQFSEQQIDNADINGGTHPAYPFLTGHGGFLHIAPMAWAGFRFNAEALVLKPRLPPQIPFLRLPQFHWMGATLDLEISQTEFILTRTKTKDTFLADAYAGRALPVSILAHHCPSTPPTTNASTHSLLPGATLVLPIPSLCPTDPITLASERNIIHCAPASSTADTLPGRYPHAAVDGGDGTYWQPSPSSSSETTLDILRSGCARQGVIDWGERPAEVFTLWARNVSSWVRLVDGKGDISSPFNASEEHKLQLRAGNVTHFSFKASPSAADGRVCAQAWRLGISGSRYESPVSGFAWVGEMLGLGQKKVEVGATVVGIALWDDFGDAVRVDGEEMRVVAGDEEGVEEEVVRDVREKEDL